MTLLPLPFYSPDLVYCELFLFPRKDWKSKQFANISEIKRKSKEKLESVQKGEYKRCFQQWTNRLNMVINVNRKYLKGN